MRRSVRIFAITFGIVFGIVVGDYWDQPLPSCARWHNSASSDANHRSYWPLRQPPGPDCWLYL